MANKKSSVPLEIWAFLLPLFVYLLTAPHTVTFEDSGLFILAGYFWGVPHPPGYPLYTFLAHIFSWLPFGTVAFRISLLSVILGACSTFFIYLIFNHLTKKPLLSLLGALMLAFSATFWSQMIVAEVYPLNLCLSLAFFYACLRINERPTVKSFFVLGLLAALALSNHWPIFGLCAPAGLVFARKNWFCRRHIFAFLGGLGLVVLPYLMMWWRSWQKPEISFLGEIHSFADLLHYIARHYYRDSDVSVLHSWRDTVSFYGEFLSRVAYKDFFLFACPLFALGVFDQLKRRSTRAVSLSFLYLFATTSFILPFLLKLEFNDLNENVFRVFWLVPFVAYGHFVVQGALRLESARRFAGVSLLATCALANLLLHFSENNLRGDRFAEDYARVVLKSVPANAVLVASADGDVGPVAYTNMILKENPGLRLYTGTGVFFKSRIFDPLTPGVERRFQHTLNFIEENSPVYSLKNLNIFEGRKDIPGYSRFNGITYKYTAAFATEDLVTEQSLEEAKVALTGYVKNLKLNNWPYHRAALAARLCNILVLKGAEDHEVFQRSPECQQVLARHMMATGRREKADELFINWMSALKHPILREKQQYIFHFFVNRLEIVNSLKSQPERQRRLITEALPIVEKTLIEYPLCDNRLYGVLNSIRNQIQLSAAAVSQLSVFAKCASQR